MALGLLILVSVGKENIYLSTQPEITFFKIAYKRYTNFSIETVAQYFKTIPDFGRRVTVNISKNADLLGKCFLFVNLPDIITSNSSILPYGIKKFAWDKKIGLALIRYIDLEIGGILIERHFNDWLNIWFELTTSLGQKSGYNKIIGDIELLTTYTNGKKSYSLNIPLNFWFCQDSGLALPLVSMIHNDIKIHVEFNNFSTCFRESPTHFIKIDEPYCLYKKGEIIKQNVEGNITIGEFVYFDYINQNIYYNKLSGDFVIPVLTNSRYAIFGLTTSFECNISLNSMVIQDESYFRFNTPSLLEAYLLVNYIYLDNVERFNFINKPHEYLVPIVQNISEQVCYSSNVAYKIPFINPNKIIFWRCCLMSNIQINDLFNYSLSPLNLTSSSIIEKQQIILNSVPRMDLNNWEHYTKLQIYLNNFCSTDSNIYMFSFSLNPLDYQPSGSLNFSQIDDTYIQLTLNKNINYQNTVSIKGFGLQYNIFRISNGLSGLGYTL
jgi:hypothetical protein